mmetsp:Transcript_48694/g.156442  ORF Transcript_48694/g.156442 Transcript_48694/m.156442 type:complete len:334 (+) Transcript_48694:692-1693(+)
MCSGVRPAPVVWPRSLESAAPPSPPPLAAAAAAAAATASNSAATAATWPLRAPTANGPMPLSSRCAGSARNSSSEATCWTSPRSQASCSACENGPTPAPTRSLASGEKRGFGMEACAGRASSRETSQSKYASSTARRTSLLCFAATCRRTNSGPRKSLEQMPQRNFEPATSCTKASHHDISHSTAPPAPGGSAPAPGGSAPAPVAAVGLPPSLASPAEAPAAASSRPRRRTCSSRCCNSFNSVLSFVRSPSRSTSRLAAASSASMSRASWPSSALKSPVGGRTSVSEARCACATSLTRATTPLIEGLAPGFAAQQRRMRSAQSSGTPAGICGS